jgi:sulfur carrier protein ThiS
MPEGYITVKVGKLPGTIQEVALDGGHKVGDAIEASELDYSEGEGYEIKVNAQPASPETELKEGDVVLLVRKIRGN